MTSLMTPPTHFSILIVNIFVESSNNRPVDEQRTHHHNGLQYLPQGHLAKRPVTMLAEVNTQLHPPASPCYRCYAVGGLILIT